MPKKSTSSVHNIEKDKPAFGSRFLTEKDDVWSQNAWDHVAPPSDQDEKITASLEKQRSNPVPPHEKQIYNDKPAKHWDNFYKANENHFFRNRKWLHNEFPELVAATKADAGPIVITELGCGAGNSIFPLLTLNRNPHLRLKAYDYSHHAIKLVQRDPLYFSTSNPKSPPSPSPSPSDSEPNPTVIGTITAAVWDLTSPSLPSDLEESSVDIVILVFVLSALSPDEWGRAVANIHKILKPNGLVLLRDYGRYDLTQLRFKGGRLLDENFYIRGDRTRVYFFELDELALLFTGLKAPANSHTHPKASVRQSVGLEYVDDDEDTQLLPVTIIASHGDAEDVYIHPDSGVREVSVCSCDSDSTPAPSPPPGEDRSNDPTSVGSGVPPPSIISTANELELPTALTYAISHIHPSLVPPPSSPPHQAQVLSQEATPSFTHLPNCPPHPLFTAEQLGVDRRLIVNRKRRVKMYRVWMQGVFKKISRP